MNLYNSTPESQTIQLGNRQRAWMDTSPKEDIQMPKIHLKKYSMTLIIRERQLQTTMMRYHLTPVRTVIINKSTNNKCWWQCEGKRSLVHCRWECRLGSTVENSMWFPQKLKNWLFGPVIPLFAHQDAKIRALWYPAIAFGVKPWLSNIHWSILLGKFYKLHTSNMYRFYMSRIFQYSGFQ